MGSPACQSQRRLSSEYLTDGRKRTVLKKLDPSLEDLIANS